VLYHLSHSTSPTDKKFLKKYIINVSRDEMKWNHIKCSSKTVEGREKQQAKTNAMS
jgi:hypothetical protein